MKCCFGVLLGAKSSSHTDCPRFILRSVLISKPIVTIERSHSHLKRSSTLVGDHGLAAEPCAERRVQSAKKPSKRVTPYP